MRYNGQTMNMPQVELPVIPERVFRLTDYGAKGDGSFNNTGAFADAITACSEAGGGTVWIPAGLWLTGPIQLQSKVRLHTESGALVTFSTEFGQYPLIASNYEGLEAVRAMPPIYGDGISDIAITGEGIFDGSGEAWRCTKKHKLTSRQWDTLVASGGVVDESGMWWPDEGAIAGSKAVPQLQAEGVKEFSAYEPYKAFLRPVLLGLTNCKRILLDGPTFQNSASWCLHPRLCEHVTIRNSKVRNPSYSSNGDGVDIDSCLYVHIHHSLFDVGDDAICLKSGKNEQGRLVGRPTEFVLIHDCVVYHGHGGFTIGSEMSGGVRHVEVADCAFIGTDNGLRFKSARGRGGVVENISVSRIYMKNIVRDAIVFDLYYEIKQDYADEAAIDEGTPVFRHIRIQDTYCTGAANGIFIRGLPEMPISRLSFERLKIAADKGVTCIDGQDIEFRHVHILSKEGPRYSIHNSSGIRIDLPDRDKTGVAEVTGQRSKEIEYVYSG